MEVGAREHLGQAGDARHDGRANDQLRDIKITRNWLDHAEGSVLVGFGDTKVLVTAQSPEDPAPRVRNTATCEGHWRKLPEGWRLSRWTIYRDPAA